MTKSIDFLNLPTIIFVNGILSFVSGMLFLAFWNMRKNQPRSASLLLWSLSHFMVSAGFLGLLILKTPLPLWANMLIDAGAAFALVATNLLFQRRHAGIYALSIAGSLALIEIGYVLFASHPVREVMLGLGCTLRAMLAITTGVTFWRYGQPTIRPPARLAAVLHLTLAGMMMVRCLPLIFGDVGISLELNSTLSLLIRMLLTWMIAICLLWMYARQLDEQLLWHANRDSLTGLKNRRVMWELGERRGAGNSVSDVSVILLDIDNFKSINDRWGHPVGDIVLKSVAGEIEKLIGDMGDVGRVGGEEFMILLDPSCSSKVRELAESVRRSIEDLIVPISISQEIHCTVSLGYSISSPNRLSWEEMVSHSDTAMYAAKNNGRNRVIGYGDGTSSPAHVIPFQPPFKSSHLKRCTA